MGTTPTSGADRSGPGTVPAFQHLCKRVRFPRSGCRRCQEICPGNAINLGPGPFVGEGCTGCGLCLAACPMEVFQGETHRDQDLLLMVGAHQVFDRSTGVAPSLYLHCGQAEPQDRRSLYIPCLGSFTECFLLGAVLQGVESIRLTRGECTRCGSREGGRLFDEILSVFHVLADTIGLRYVHIGLEERKKDVKSSDRRRFFSRVLRRADEGLPPVAAAGDLRGPAAAPAGPAVGTRPSPGRTLLRMLLEALPAVPDTSVEGGAPSAPWARMTVRAGDCTACGICVGLCPTGAVSATGEADRWSLLFNSASCTNCRLCEEACPERVIVLGQGLSLSGLFQDEVVVVTRIALQSCHICGEAIPVKEGRYCTTCRRRRMGETYRSHIEAGGQK